MILLSHTTPTLSNQLPFTPNKSILFPHRFSLQLNSLLFFSLSPFLFGQFLQDPSCPIKEIFKDERLNQGTLLFQQYHFFVIPNTIDGFSKTFFFYTLVMPASSALFHCKKIDAIIIVLCILFPPEHHFLLFRQKLVHYLLPLLFRGFYKMVLANVVLIFLHELTDHWIILMR